MPIIKSAKKRVKTAAKAYTRNSKTRRQMRQAIKTLSQALSEGKSDTVDKAMREAVSAIDTASKKNVIHKNKAARKKAQLAKSVKASGIKPAKSVSAKSSVASPKPKAKKRVRG